MVRLVLGAIGIFALGVCKSCLRRVSRVRQLECYRYGRYQCVLMVTGFWAAGSHIELWMSNGYRYLGFVGS